MRVGVGVSTGSEVVCAALVTVDTDGSQTVEYRTVSADRQANTDMGDLVISAIELMTSLIPGRRSPDAIAVTYRTEERAAGIRAALAHTTRDVRLVPESSAAVAHLVTTGLIDGYDTIALVDLGASGLSVTVTDRATGAVLAHDRSDAVGGDAVDALVKYLVQDMTRDNLRDDIRDDRGIGSARYRSIKEQLSSEDEVRIERYSGSPLIVTRDAFDTAVAPMLDTAAQFVRGVFDISTHEPEAIVLIGGGAHIPLLATTLIDLFHAPVVRLTEPDAMLAVGAATVAASTFGGKYQLVTAGRRTSGRMGRYSGAIAAAVVAGGLVLAYGVQTMSPVDDPDVTPAGSAAESTAESGDSAGPMAEGSGGSVSSTSGRDPGDPSVGSPDTTEPSAQFTTSAAATTTPTLRPAPDLPSIEWPIGPASNLPSPPVTAEASPQSQPALTTSAIPSSGSVEISKPNTSTPISPEPTPVSPEPTPVSPEPTPIPTVELTPESTEEPTTPGGVPPSVRGEPELTAPPTVWSPPVPIPPEASALSTEPTVSAEPTVPRTTVPRTTEPSGGETQDQPGT